MALGLLMLYEPPANNFVDADLIFVHGLNGSGLETWSSGNVCWPRDLLKEDISNVRIFTYNYDSAPLKVLERTSRTSIFGHAESILNEIARCRRHLNEVDAFRPIVFVCHSLGGLLVKEVGRLAPLAIVRSAEYRHNRLPHHSSLGAIFFCVSGVIFLGTPHRGSSQATIAKCFAKAAKALDANDNILQVLERNADILERERNSFDSLRKDLFIACLYEELPMPILGMIVPETSACIDGPDVLKEQIPGRNHRSMVKFASRDEKQYEIVSYYIQRAVEVTLSDISHRDEQPGLAPSNSMSWPFTYSMPVRLIIESCILDSLRFHTMDDRYNGIESAYKSVVGAHKSTYDWMFDRPGPGFVDWLEKGHGIFWINGKAGSGKSTLMKFIRDDPKLNYHLKGTTGNWKEVMIADFYFWAAGSAEQHSQTGLLMTILYRILNQVKKLLPIVAPREWGHVGPIAARIVQDDFKSTREARGSRGLPLTSNQSLLVRVYQEACLQWTRQALLQVFHDLLVNLPPSTLLLLILDGLDEYEAKEQEMEELTELLKQTGRMSNVKICLSTRPWTIFENQFGGGQYPTFQLQHLTHNDIESFVTESLNRSMLIQNLLQAYPKQVPDIFSTIVLKAEGVFLWVRLVVRSLIRAFQNGDELSDLQKKVDELPEDLERLYKHMLDRIEPKYWKRSSKIFCIVDAALDPLYALTVWYSGEAQANPLEDLAVETKLARCYQLHLRLMSQCAGLLELRHDGSNTSLLEDYSEADLLRQDESWSFSERQHYLRSRVHHLHRTTKDFLDRPDISSILSSRRAPFFDVHKWLAIHTLVELRSATVISPRYASEADLWDGTGFHLSRINQTFSSYAANCRAGDSALRLSKIRDIFLRSVGTSATVDARFVRCINQVEGPEFLKTKGWSSVDASDEVKQELDCCGRKELETLLLEEGVKID